ncbi:hypothetical protein [uncultured Ramlibacter sp.]|uniref:hypothetical protein n=1 Tax=uncultured Ramlibacter sp. TaxID=260755 RepID=UPI00262C69EC|nr:hypothetical protein [uncultured Ramlibacter sp.]
MYAVFAQIVRLLQAAKPLRNEVPHHLLERADVRAGRSPRHAQELREAAYAYLSVVR